MSSSPSTAPPFAHQSALLSAAVRARSGDAIRPFEVHAVRSLWGETRGIGCQLARAAAQFRQEEGSVVAGGSAMDAGEVCGLKTAAATARHNKRVLLSYAMERRNALLDAYWTSSGSVLSESLSKVLAPAEVEYLGAHAAMIQQLARPYRACTVNLLGSLSSGPPRALFIQVECVRQLGEVAVGDGGGVVQFDLGSRYLVKRADVEGLIQGGWLKEVES